MGKRYTTITSVTVVTSIYHLNKPTTTMPRKFRNLERNAGEPLPNIRHELFCKLYATDPVIQGNATKCYQKAYNIEASGTKYNSAKTGAYALLTEKVIRDRINEHLSDEGFNDENVTKQHLFLINQAADLPTKKGAIEMYYKIKGKMDDKQRIEGELIFKWGSDEPSNNNSIPAQGLGDEAP